MELKNNYLTLCGLILLISASDFPEALSSFTTSSSDFPFIKASVWAKKLLSKIYVKMWKDIVVIALLIDESYIGYSFITFFDSVYLLLPCDASHLGCCFENLLERWNRLELFLFLDGLVDKMHAARLFQVLPKLLDLCCNQLCFQIEWCTWSKWIKDFGACLRYITFN